MTIDAAALTPVIGAAYEHPSRGRMKVLRSVVTEWHLKWDQGQHEQVNMTRWKRLVREGMRKV